ncbi:Cell division control protein 11 [Cucumispora dikerogammari]|nr:Cell division control protein 11 [Cucumispora dikerogammari]
MSLRKQQPFNIMITGRIGLGKTSFINTLLNNNIINITKPKDNSINIYSLNLPLKQSKKINIIMTPNLNFELSDSILHENIEKYIKDQFNKYLNEETKIKRNIELIDSRINVMLFFISSSGLTESDIFFLKRVSHLVNVLPVIGKADGFTSDEIDELRAKVKKQFFEFQLRLFKFENDLETCGSEVLNNIGKSAEEIEGLNLNDLIPFRISNRCWLVKDEERYNGNLHVNFDSWDVSDFQILREILFSELCDELINTTHFELYEKYREEVLSKLVSNTD